jgi:putative heme-binding domain-containing protein
MWIKRCTLLAVSSVLIYAQHDATQSDVEAGQAIFQAGCARCHGAEGDGVAGINLLRGQFRRVTSEADIPRIVQAGIAGTAMPPGNYTDRQIQTIVAYLHSTAEAAAKNPPIPGDPARGRVVVEGKGECLSCHRIRGVGSRSGPELTDIGLLRTSIEIQQSLLDPGVIRVENRMVRATKHDGTTITGRLLNQDRLSIQLLDEKERLVSLSRSDLKDVSFIEKSPMPSYRDKLNSQELGDVINYLHSLKGVQNQ